MKIRRVTITLVTCLAITTGCRTGKEDASLGSRQKVTICQFAQVFVYLPLYIAKEKGFFEQEGLDISLINGGGDDKTFAAVASGQAQFGVADPTFAAIAREKGQPGLVLASVVNGATFLGRYQKGGNPTNHETRPIERLANCDLPGTFDQLHFDGKNTSGPRWGSRQGKDCARSLWHAFGYA